MAGGWDGVKLVLRPIQPFLSDSGHLYWHWNPVVVSYLAVWNQIQGWIQGFLIATDSILQSVCVWGGGGGGGVQFGYCTCYFFLIFLKILHGI